MKEELSIVSFLQAMRPELATQLTRERLDMVKEIATLRANLKVAQFEVSKLSARVEELETFKTDIHMN